MPDTSTEVPAAILEALDRLKTELAQAAGDNFAGLVLYGGVARRRWRPGRSDVNVVVLLKDASAPALAAISPALRAASREAAVVPLLLTPADVPRVAEAFPTKFLDIRDHHAVLAGADPFAVLAITPEQVRGRVAQELRNLQLRLRNRLVGLAGDETMLAQTLARNARPFAIQLSALLFAAGRPAPADDRTATVYDTAAEAFGLDRETLARLAALRADVRPQGEIAALYHGVLDAVTKAADTADGMSRTPR